MSTALLVSDLAVQVHLSVLYHQHQHRYRLRYSSNKCLQNIKVCLSLLGTWRKGDQAAQWQPDISTILSVLVSLQAMVLSEDPFRQEPANNAEILYILDVRPQNIKFAMIDWLREPGKRNGVWKDVVKTHFTRQQGEDHAEDEWLGAGGFEALELEPASGENNQGLDSAVERTGSKNERLTSLSTAAVLRASATKKRTATASIVIDLASLICFGIGPTRITSGPPAIHLPKSSVENANLASAVWNGVPKIFAPPP
ncbi:predicted protein [Histoplasma capsulatum G186AR]|uniref:Uncharacterized protein n=1 Tax=Ajellomyces capsulatus (strain G186AR / H82 / ATCC MYA-2454 / RMSCC 2432) TaxID=447093 RepID=C0NK77_AJECG|nr:uncharacterized protein HCBG_03557 [Histoplasma capsulatum G186AR]EEH08268.1 predicted protein [Histoplasma capsulatum G186AR]